MKKCISLIIIFCLMMQSFVLPVNAWNRIDWLERAKSYGSAGISVIDDQSIIINVGEDGVQASENEQQISIAYDKLLSIGIVKGDSYDTSGEENGITRAAFVQMALRALNIESVSVSKNIFADVNSGHFAYNEIGTAVDMGLISGNNGVFRPDDEITYNEAICILVHMLGLRTQAQHKGGYPIGYTMVAKSADILVGLDVNDMNQVANGEDLYKLMLNTVESTDYARVQGVQNENLVYQTGRNILETCHDIYSIEGVIDAVGYSNILSDSKYEKNIVKMGSMQFEGDYDACIDYLGLDSEILYRHDNSALDEIVHICATSKNEIIIINSEDASYLNGTYTYYVDGRERKVKIESDASVIYNGRINSIGVANLHVPEMGSITLIDNNNSGGIDVVKVDAIEDIIVGTVIEDEGIIYDYMDKSLSVDMDIEDNDKIISLINNSGVAIYPSMLSQKNILSVRRSADGSIVYGIVSSEIISGKIESLSEKETGKVITVDGTEYKITKRCSTNFEKILKPGKEVTLYLDTMNYVAFAEEGLNGATSGMEYAYVINTAIDNERFDEKLMVKLLNADGTITINEFAESCKIDSERCKTAMQQNDALNAGLALGRVIRISKNDEGLIKEVDTAVYNSTKEEKQTSLHIVYNQDKFNEDKANGLLRELEISSGGLIHKGGSPGGYFSEAIYWNPNKTVIFEVLANAPSEEDGYRVNSGISPWKNDEYAVPEAYRSEDSFYAGAIVSNKVYNENEIAVKSSDMYVVKQIVNTLQNDEEVIGLYVTKDGTNEKFITVDKDKFATRDIGEGDIVVFELIGDSKVMGNSIISLYDYSEDKIVNNTFGDKWWGGEFNRAAAYVYDIKDGIVAFYETDNIDDLSIVDDDSFVGSANIRASKIDCKIVKVTSGRKRIEVESGSQKDLKTYVGCGNEATRVVLKYRYLSLNQVFIFE